MELININKFLENKIALRLMIVLLKKLITYNFLNLPKKKMKHYKTILEQYRIQLKILKAMIKNQENITWK